MNSMDTIPDEELVAYSDSALDTVRTKEIDAALKQDKSLAARLGALDFDKDAIFASFEAVADTAPLEILRSQLQDQAKRRLFSSSAGSQWLKVAAALLVGIGVGWGAGRLDGQDLNRNWRLAVADYQRLYTTSTLSTIASNLAIEREEVATVADKLGLPIKLEQLYLAELKFKRAQLLEFDGRLLAQFAYLDPEGIPLSFCVTRSNRPNRPVQVNKLRGLSAASWDKNGYGFILIGAGRAESLRQAADALSRAI